MCVRAGKQAHSTMCKFAGLSRFQKWMFRISVGSRKSFTLIEHAKNPSRSNFRSQVNRDSVGLLSLGINWVLSKLRSVFAVEICRYPQEGLVLRL